MVKTLQELTRPNIWRLKPYSSARDEYNGAAASVFLDANENPYNMPHNRYPDPMQRELKTELSKIKKVSPDSIFLGNGSDEAIDLVFRAFCEPRVDNVVAIDPTYGMYQVCADVNDVEYRKVLLDEDFQFSADKLLAAADEHTKLIFICSPNNPTGNDLLRSEIETLIRQFDGLVILDEAYNDFSEAPSFLENLNRYPNLIVLQTFSKAWGCAAIRLGMAFASPEIIGILSKIKYPYNVNQLTQKQAVDALAKAAGATFTDGRYGFTTTLSVKGRQLLLLKPSTFMNLSGNAVRYWMQKENIPLENVLVVVDDLALPFGTLRLKGKGSDAGHNGLKHIASTLGTQNYARLRFGIGNDFPRGGQIDYVLGHFTDEDWKTMDERLETAGEIIKSFCLAGIDITMNQYNKK